MLSRLYTVLLVFLVVGASWAALGTVSGTAVFTIVVALAIYVGAAKSRLRRSLCVATAIVCLLAAVCLLLLPAIDAARESARCGQCRNKLKQIALGLQWYRDSYGCYPPPCTYDKAGRPQHSWRLLINPHICTIPAFDSYNFKEPWDGPSNRTLLVQDTGVYQCPSVHTTSALNSTSTSYLAVVGRRASSLWDNDASHENPDSKTRAADTFLVVETASSGIHWMEPKDVCFDDVQALRSLAANGPHLRDNGYFFHPTPGVNAMLLDGDRIFMFAGDSTPRVLTARWLPPNDAEAIMKRVKDDPLDHLYTTEELRIHWPHCIGLPMWVVAVGLLFYQAIRSRKARQKVTGLCP